MKLDEIQSIKAGSYIFISNDRKSSSGLFKKITKLISVEDRDKIIIDQSEKIKIKQIREIKNKLYFSSGCKSKLLVIFNSENLTLEAANSTLKILEEPPKNTIIVLITVNLNNLLPTIISRCKIVHIRSEVKDYDSYENIGYYDELIKSQYFFDRVKIIDKILNKKIELKSMLNDWILYLRKSNDNTKYKQISHIYKFLKKYKIGVNKKLFLENIAIKI